MKFLRHVLRAPETETGGGGGGHDVDALMATIEAGGEVSEAPQSEPAAPQPQAPQDFEFEVDGKPIKAAMDKAKVYASNGYRFSQNMQKFNADKAAFEKAQKEFEPLKARYSEIDEFAKQNPQWLEHVNRAYLEAIGKAKAEGQPVEEIQALRQELLELKKFRDELTTERSQAKQQEDDQKLSGQIQAIQDKYKDLDWKTPDAEGKTMEVRVLEFGIQNGIKNFEQAFKLLNHDHLITLHASKAKEDLTKAKQAQTKAGVLGSTPSPTKALTKTANVKSKSYNDLTREALEELGIA